MVKMKGKGKEEQRGLGRQARTLSRCGTTRHLWSRQTETMMNGTRANETNERGDAYGCESRDGDGDARTRRLKSEITTKRETMQCKARGRGRNHKRSALAPASVAINTNKTTREINAIQESVEMRRGMNL